MTEFNSDKHVFGMAYHNAERDYICWPDDRIRHFRKMEGGICETWGCDRTWWKDEAPKQLCRSPEHDFIPRADVVNLLQALQNIIDYGNDIYGGIGDIASKALSDFKDKYGDLS